MRGLIPGLETPHPIGVQLPALYHEDEFVQRFVSGLDDVMAPVFATLDNLPAYFDPKLAPPDFVAWLADWVGALLDETWPPERQRALVADTVGLYEWRGTVRGIKGLVRIYTGTEPEVVETGSCTWSPAPGGEVGGEAVPTLRVIAHVPDPGSIDLARLDAIVAMAKPAHVEHTVEVVAA